MTPYYERDGIAIYHGDCREILPTLDPVDLVLTDPPYGIGLANHDSTGMHRRLRSWDVVNDECTELATWAIKFARSSGWGLCVFCSPDKPFAGTWRNRLVWWKDGLGMGGDPATCWRRDWELILVDGVGTLTGGRDSAILRHTIRPSEFMHPCQKPLGLMRYLIEKISSETILDPFMGSGTTLRAAKDLGRNAIGIEIEEKYCEIAANRLAQGVLDFA